MAEWISVNDRLPEPENVVLVCNVADGFYALCFIELDRGNKFWGDGEYRWDIDEFTHWMPPPEPPKEAADA